MVQSFVSSFNGALLAVVALLQGIAFAAMVYVLRRNKRFDAQTVGTGGLALLAGMMH